MSIFKKLFGWVYSDAPEIHDVLNRKLEETRLELQQKFITRKGAKMASYPRVYVSKATHAKVAKIAKKQNTTMIKLGNKIVLAGLKALEL